LSYDALASRLPSGENATDATAPVWPSSGAPIGCPLSASHSRTLRSPLPGAVLAGRDKLAAPPPRPKPIATTSGFLDTDRW
jgi:hypothetical protein